MSKMTLDWIKRFSDCELPVLYDSKYQLQKLQEDGHDITVTVLTDIARQDPGFAITLLRYAGCNTKREITTLSHAISLISIPFVIKMLTDSPVLEKVKDEETIKRIKQVYAYDFQNAFIAREWSVLRKESENNEIFTAGLNRGFVRFMLYLVEPEKAEALEKIYLTPSDDHKQQEKNILGDSVDVLSEKIAKHWNLPELIRESYSGKHHNPKITGIRLSAELMHQIYTHASVQYPQQLIVRVAEYMRVPVLRAPGKVNHILAMMMRKSYTHLPTQPLLLNLMCYPQSSKPKTIRAKKSDVKKAPSLAEQIKRLRSEQAHKTAKQLIDISVNALKETVGFSRVVFLSLDRNENCLKTVSCIYDGKNNDLKQLQISLELSRLFEKLLNKEQFFPITSKNQHKYSGLLPEKLRPQKPVATIIIHSFFIHNRAAGCIFVDHGQISKPLTKLELQSFKLICKELKSAIESSYQKKQSAKKVA